MDNKKFEECPVGKCFLMLIYPNSDASIACDCDCYFKEGEGGEKYLQSYIKKHKDKWEQLNSKQ